MLTQNCPWLAGRPEDAEVVLLGRRKVPGMTQQAYWDLEPAEKLGMLATLCYNVLNTHIIRCSMSCMKRACG